jgi:hypothetical protein
VVIIQVATMEQEAVTIRIPADLLKLARQFGEGNDFNEMVVEALAREVRRRRSLSAHQRIVARSAEVEAITGIQVSSAELIRQLRASEGRRD